jgi:hypothetical protein
MEVILATVWAPISLAMNLDEPAGIVSIAWQSCKEAFRATVFQAVDHVAIVPWTPEK